MNDSPFPDLCPSGCPPEGAKDADGVYFRSVNNNPPTADDFLSYLELGKRVSKKKACEACGLSVMETIEDAVHQRNALPGVFKYVAWGRLAAKHGKTMPTPNATHPSHVEWWPYKDTVRREPFEVIEGL